MKYAFFIAKPRMTRSSSAPFFLLLVLFALSSALLQCHTFPNAPIIPDELRVTITKYFDGRRRADLNLLRQAFSPRALMQTRDAKGELLTISLDEYLRVVRKKGPVEVKTRILEFSTEGKIAVVKTLFRYSNKTYVDYLSLVKEKGGWRITNKTFIQTKQTIKYD